MSLFPSPFPPSLHPLAPTAADEFYPPPPPLPPLEPFVLPYFGDEDMAAAQFYAVTAPNGAIGQAAYQHDPPHPAFDFDNNLPSPPLRPLQPPAPHHSTITTTATTATYHSLPSTTAAPTALDPLSTTTTNTDDIETSMRRSILTDPFHLFCPAGLSTLPNPLSGGAFLPLRYVDTARAKGGEMLESGPCWSVYLYGPQEKVVAFCLHADCVRERQEESPFKGFMCPANLGTMNRHYREQHHMFDPRKAKAEGKEREEKAQQDDGNNNNNSGSDNTSPRGKRKSQRPSTTKPRKTAKTVKGATPHIKTEDGGGSSGGKAEKTSQASTQRTRQRMVAHSTSMTWSQHAHLQRQAPTTPVWLEAPSSDSSAYPSSSSSAASSSSSSSSSASLASSDHDPTHASASTAASAHNVTRTRLSSVVYPYNLMSAMREFGGFLAHFVRLNWNILAGQVRRLSQTNDLGRLVAQLHILNAHCHTVRFQTAAGLISDNDGVCSARSGCTETATRIRGVSYEVVVECKECGHRRMHVLTVGLHYVLTGGLEIRPMTAAEYAVNQEQTGYRLPAEGTTVGVMRLEGDVMEQLRREMNVRHEMDDARQEAENARQEMARWNAMYAMQPPRSRM